MKIKNNKAKNKVIHLYFRNYKSFFWNKDNPNYYFGGWASLQAKGMSKYSSEIQQEVWRPELETNKIRHSYHNDVKGKIFPFNEILKKYSLNPYSLIKSLYNECNNNNTIINLHYIHSIASIIIIFLFQNHPIFVHHHGSIPFKDKNKNGFIKKLLNFMLEKIDRYLLKKVDYFSVISKTEKNYLKQITGNNNIILEQGRKFYKNWKPINKVTARKKLDLPLNKKIIMYVGFYYKLKGVDALLEAYKKLKNEDDLSLLMIGGKPDDELYPEVQKSDAIDCGRVPNDEMKYYYSAADLYVTGAFNNSWVKYGGISTAVIESIACNTPVVSAQLNHFPNNNFKKVGDLPLNKEELYKYIKEVLNNPNKYSPRKYSKKYYDFEVVLSRNNEIYNHLINQYYTKGKPS